LAVVCLVAIPVEAGSTYYVRGDGSGSDANSGADWTNAWASLQKVLDTVTGAGSSAADPHVVNVQASTGGQAYHSAEKVKNFGNLYMDFEGGWTNVDANPVQTGTSAIKDTDPGTPDEAGLRLDATGSAHDQKRFIGVNRFEMSNVTDGVRMLSPSNLNRSQLNLTLTNTTIAAQADGVDLEFQGASNHGRATKITTDHVDIQAGLGGAGNGIQIQGFIDGSVIENAHITSATGRGINIDNHGPYSNWAAGYTLTIRDTVVENCAGDGIHKQDAVGYHYNTPSTITLEEVKVVNCGGAAAPGTGIYLEQNQGSNSGSGRVMVVNMTNCLSADNTGYGIQLLGNADSLGAEVVGTLVNCTVANNGDDGLYLVSNIGSGNSATVRNTIFSDPDDDGVVLQDPSASGPAVTETDNDFYGYGGATSAILRNGVLVVLDPTDLTADPMFLGSGNDPYDLTSGPCVDTANAAYAPAIDVLGRPRPTGPGFDRGAYEMQAGPIPEPGVLGLLALGLPVLLLRKRRKGTMSGNSLSVFLLVLACLLAMPCGASAAPSLLYEGSFNLPSASAWVDYYYGQLTFVPDGTARPGWNGAAVQGPTVLGETTWAHKTREFGPVPAFSKTAAGLQTAPLVTNANGGTELDGGSAPDCVDLNGDLYGRNTTSMHTDGAALYSNPGTSVLGGTATLTAAPESGWPGAYANDGVLRRGDGSGGDLTTDASAAGAKFLVCRHPNAGPGYYLDVHEVTRVDATTVSSARLFRAFQQDFSDGYRQMDYIRDTLGAEWVVLMKPGAHTGDSFTVDLYDGTLSGDVNADPTYQFDIGPDIAAGAGWHTSDSRIKDVAVDWANSQLYVLDGGAFGTGNNRAARVHVFSLKDEVAPIPEPGVLGLVALGLSFVFRRKRRGRAMRSRIG
jgi:hypothetical protein